MLRKMKLDVDREWKSKGIMDGFIDFWPISLSLRSLTLGIVIAL